MMNNKLALYLHFPFCKRKCRYCDFLSFPADGQERERYILRLLEEIRCKASSLSGRTVSAIYMGGGTPSLMSGAQMGRLMDCIRENFSLASDAEITAECNPGTVDFDKLAAYRQAGINRISFGLQSSRQEELDRLGRIHSCGQFEGNYYMARKAGFDNINIDLMSGLPGQSLESWQQTLRFCVGLAPEHISAYSLIVEPGTPFEKLYGEDGSRREELPDEDTEREMYHATARILAAAGYGRYEISNYSLPGRQCRHNLVYWLRGDYLGLGLGSSSMICNCRMTNPADYRQYMESFEPAGREIISRKGQIGETMILGLRLMQGVDEAAFEAAFGTGLHDIYGDVIEGYCRQGFLQDDGKYLSLTEKGIDVSNWILADFLLDEE